MLLTGGTDGVFAAGADIAQLRDRGRLDALAAINMGLFERIRRLPMPIVGRDRRPGAGWRCRARVRLRSAGLHARARSSGSPRCGSASSPARVRASGCRRWSARVSPRSCCSPAAGSRPTRRSRSGWSTGSSTTPEELLAAAHAAAGRHRRRVAARRTPDQAGRRRTRRRASAPRSRVPGGAVRRRREAGADDRVLERAGEAADAMRGCGRLQLRNGDLVGEQRADHAGGLVVAEQHHRVGVEVADRGGDRWRTPRVVGALGGRVFGRLDRCSGCRRRSARRPESCSRPVP